MYQYFSKLSNHCSVCRGASRPDCTTIPEDRREPKVEGLVEENNPNRATFAVLWRKFFLILVSVCKRVVSEIDKLIDHLMNV